MTKKLETLKIAFGEQSSPSTLTNTQFSTLLSVINDTTVTKSFSGYITSGETIDAQTYIKLAQHNITYSGNVIKGVIVRADKTTIKGEESVQLSANVIPYPEGSIRYRLYNGEERVEEVDNKATYEGATLDCITGVITTERVSAFGAYSINVTAVCDGVESSKLEITVNETILMIPLIIINNNATDTTFKISADTIYTSLRYWTCIVSDYVKGSSETYDFKSKLEETTLTTTETAITLQAGETFAIWGSQMGTRQNRNLRIKITDKDVDFDGDVLGINGNQIGQHCCSKLFWGSTAITKTPKIKSSVLEEYCYNRMFSGCTSLVNAPELPATELAGSCYAYMFYGCTSLINPPLLPANVMKPNCYDCMFAESAIASAPTLSSTTLASKCYSQMFYNCTSLVNAPDLPATELATQCYNQMFQKCSSLQYVKIYATDVSATNCLYNWLNGVNATGTIVEKQGVITETGASGNPENWTVEYMD